MDRVDEGRVDGIQIGSGRGHVGRVKKGQLDEVQIGVIPYEIGTSFHPTPSDFAINGVYCRVLIVRKLCQVSLSYLEPFPRKSVRRLTFTDLRGLAEIATS